MIHTNISTATTTVVADRKCFLARIIINKAVASGVITIYDNTSAAGTKVGTITYPATLLGSDPVCLEYASTQIIGLTIVTSAATDLTVIWE